MWFFVGLLLFIACVIIQFLAMNRIAFGRSIFIAMSMFVFGAAVWLSPTEIAKYLCWLFFGAGWIFLLFMTFQSLRHFRMKKLTNTKS